MSPIWRNNWVGNRTQHSPTHIGNCAPNGGVRWDGLISIVTPQRRRTHSTSPWIIHILQYTIQSGSCQVFTLPCREHDGPGAVRRRARAVVVLPLLFCGWEALAAPLSSSHLARWLLRLSTRVRRAGTWHIWSSFTAALHPA